MNKNKSLFDFLIVGNGAIGTLAAIKIKNKFPEKSVAILGNFARSFSASIAAGAMANVYAELEKCSGNALINQDKYLEMGKIGSSGWLEFFQETNGMSSITAMNTEVFLKKKASSFETENFNYVLESAKRDKVGALLNLRNKQKTGGFPFDPSRIENVVLIEGEFAICTGSLFKHFENLLKSNAIELINEDCSEINSDEDHLVTKLGRKLNFRNLIVAAGSRTANLFPDGQILPMLQGVGTAILIESTVGTDLLGKSVVRTVNRGGAQCGFHLVPRTGKKWYLGAGNYVTKPGDSYFRLETIKYLLTILEEELLSKDFVYNLTGDFVLGNRPRSIDGFPMIGPISTNESIYVATGTNRAGLTWAPFITDQILDWIIFRKQSEIIKNWAPDRSPISYGNKESAINYFKNSRLSNALEHKLVSQDQVEFKLEEIENSALELRASISERYSFSEEFNLNPDSWGPLK
jgi:glycine/D-amino acid oxidase-like deaminating enzyme